MFNCERCNKKLWTTYRKLPDGTVVCNDCYSFYLTQILDKIKDKQAYDIIYNFAEKYSGKYPFDLIQELVRLLAVKYHINVDTATFKELLNLVYENIEKENNLIKLIKLERELKHEPTGVYQCEICDTELPLSEYKYSMENFGKALCLTHQREKRASPHALKLYEALKKRNIFCTLETYDNAKHIDLTLKEAKLYVGIDGEHHSLDPEQLHLDLLVDEESYKKGFATKRYTLQEIDDNLDIIADALTAVVELRCKKFQKDQLLTNKTFSKPSTKFEKQKHKDSSLKVLK